jgi:hypothetical protein
MMLANILFFATGAMTTLAAVVWLMQPHGKDRTLERLRARGLHKSYGD